VHNSKSAEMAPANGGPLSHGTAYQDAVHIVPIRLIRMPAVRAMTSLSKAWIYALERQGKFPKRVKIGERISAWVEGEVAQWVQAQAATREGSCGDSRGNKSQGTLLAEPSCTGRGISKHAKVRLSPDRFVSDIGWALALSWVG